MTRLLAVQIRRMLASSLAVWLFACGGGASDPGSGDGGGGADAATDGGATDGGGGDGGPRDASTMDGASEDGATAMTDAAADDAAGPDAGVACDPSAVDFPMGGSLEEGQLCDEVFVCAEDADDASRIEAASDHFACEEHEGGSFCDAGYQCPYRDPDMGTGPGTLEPDEIEQICHITVLEPTPPITCIVYL